MTRKILLSACTLAIMVFNSPLSAQDETSVDLQDSTGLPGDNFSLEGAMDLFKSSASPEDFEKKLNSADSKVNNLDLNGDGKIDYIKVEDNAGNSAHAIILRVDVSASETQDVAVIEIEKTGDEEAQAQIIGSEELYGDKKIVEPVSEEVKKSGTGPSGRFTPAKIIVNVWFWPGIKFIYAPKYVVWVSPWYWAYYPGWWKPWNPRPWRWHWAACRPYRVWCHPVRVHRVMVAHKLYGPHKKSSVFVVNKYKVAHANFHTHKKAGGGNNKVGGGKQNTGNQFKTNQGGKNKQGKVGGHKGGGGGKGGKKK
jgi:hypothetical protein